MRGSQPGERRGGRQRGTPNRATVDIRAIAQAHADDAVATLVAVMSGQDMPPAARVQAARELLAYGYGRPGPATQADPDGMQVNIYNGLPD
ncbi:MAG: hypothetical protein M0P72_01940 [Metallibacterium scheffleri]|jgi:hypothetical protein|uniref:hypothetical protein n=1 Tax=Metallibacterium scheffleri TaxID=993689 RepID=UPI0026F23DDB|nr:hypothetical protein [Metallibacterium scheffleri]MCK9365896.1 hypothetical protein [Metallibacterium scheffleri]